MAFAKFKVKKGVVVNSGSLTGDLIPVGLILPWASSTPPTGWLLCDGSGIGSTVYEDLVALIGTTLPDLRGAVLIGDGTGSGGGTSGTGQVTGGSALTARTVNTFASLVDTHPSVNTSHSHPMSNHSHPMSHTHSYPHTHSSSHAHNNNHSHTTPTDGGHSHTGFYNNQYTTGPGSAVRGSGSFINAGDPNGLHAHTPAAATMPIGSAGSHASPVATPAWAASPQNSTSPTASNTGPLGGSTSFSVIQPSTTVYFIIKY